MLQGSPGGEGDQGRLPTRPQCISFATDETPTEEDAASVSAPPFSPLTRPTISDESTDSHITEDENTTNEESQHEEEHISEDMCESVVTKECRNTWCGFRIVGDNIDKNVHRSFQRIEMQTQSLHYFHCYAVRDRIDLSGYSDCPPQRPVIESTTLLPSSCDITKVRQECETLVARYVFFVCTCEYLCVLVYIV